MISRCGDGIGYAIVLAVRLRLWSETIRLSKCSEMLAAQAPCHLNTKQVSMHLQV